MTLILLRYSFISIIKSLQLESFLDFRTIASVPMDHELIMRFTTDIKHNNELYNDQSGLEIHKRLYNASLGIPGNYCPQVIEDISVLTCRFNHRLSETRQDN